MPYCLLLFSLFSPEIYSSKDIKDICGGDQEYVKPQTIRPKEYNYVLKNYKCKFSFGNVRIDCRELFILHLRSMQSERELKRH